MRKHSFWLLSAILSALFFVPACTDPDPLGADLLNTPGDYAFADGLDIVASSTAQENILAYTPNVSAQPNTYLLGQMDDPIFGSTEASIYIQFRLYSNQTSLSRDLDFSNVVVDSVRLFLAYDTAGLYGDTLVPQSLDVFRVLEDMPNDVAHYSSKSFAISGEAVGGKQDFLVRPRSGVFDSPTDTVADPPYMSIPLDNALGADILSYDSATLSTSERFLEQFKGLYIKPQSGNKLLYSVNLGSAFSRIAIYYTQADTASLIYDLDISTLSTRFTHFEHDYSTASLAPFLDDAALGDSLLFVQGASGVNAKLSFPDVANLGNIIVNKAELVATMAYLPGDDSLFYELPAQLGIQRLNDEGRLIYLTELAEALSFSSIASFGGTPIFREADGSILREYRMNVTRYMQSIADGTAEDGGAVYISVIPKLATPRRMVLFGPGHSSYPLRLELSYTLLD